MKLYKSNTDEIFAYEEDGSQDYLIGDKAPITQAEADVIIKTQQEKLRQEWLAKQPSKEEIIAQLQAQLDALKA